MITLKQAIELATKAHKGQWRTSKVLNGDRYLSYGEEVHSKNIPYHETDWHTLSDGSQIRCNGSQHQRFPYITHPLAVMDMMDTEKEKIVAVLHDVIESTSANLEIVFGGRNSTITYNSIVYELPLTIALALHKLTHTNEETYIDYIQKVATSKLATKVKLADICHNLSDNPSEHAKQKYLKALPILLKGI